MYLGANITYPLCYPRLPKSISLMDSQYSCKGTENGKKYLRDLTEILSAAPPNCLSRKIRAGGNCRSIIQIPLLPPAPYPLNNI